MADVSGEFANGQAQYLQRTDFFAYPMIGLEIS
jgi:hypothetical protein